MRQNRSTPHPKREWPSQASCGDVDDIRRTLQLFLREPGQVTELRVILKSKGIVSGYFDDSQKAGQAAIESARRRLEAEGI